MSNVTLNVPAGSAIANVLGTDGNLYPVTNGTVTMPSDAIPSGFQFAGFSIATVTNAPA
jgi:hypothetical protein